MIYISGIVENESRVRINSQHYEPFDEIEGLHKTTEELLEMGYLVDSIPQCKPILDKVGVLFYNPQTNQFFYEYEDIPKTQEQLTQERITMLEQALNELLLGGM